MVASRGRSVRIERIAVLPPIRSRTLDSSPNTLNLMVESRHVRHIYDGGFTLIELMVTLLILSILLAIAIPTLLGVTRSANGRVAQANSSTALLDSRNVFYSASQAYQPVATMITALHSAEPGLTFQTGASTSHGQVSVYVARDDGGIIFAVQSNGKKDCWYTIVNAKIESSSSGGSTYQAYLPSTVLGIGTSYGESKAPATGAPSACIASTLPRPSATVVYQRNGYPSQ